MPPHNATRRLASGRGCSGPGATPAPPSLRPLVVSFAAALRLPLPSAGSPCSPAASWAHSFLWRFQSSLLCCSEQYRAAPQPPQRLNIFRAGSTSPHEGSAQVWRISGAAPLLPPGMRLSTGGAGPAAPATSSERRGHATMPSLSTRWFPETPEPPPGQQATGTQALEAEQQVSSESLSNRVKGRAGLGPGKRGTPETRGGKQMRRTCPIRWWTLP